jgi:hypothetical protein
MPNNPFDIWDPSPTAIFYCLIFDNGTTSGGYSNRRYLDFTIAFQKDSNPDVLDRVVAIGIVEVNKAKHLKKLGFND